MNKSPDAKALLKIFEALDAEHQASLFDYAEFLQTRSPPQQKVIGVPMDIARPDNETVVGAIKRLKRTYPMIESMSVFSAASTLMTDHMVSGRDTREVIDEMQVLFEQAYQKLLQEME
jgi:hypothetical protein